MIARWRDGAGEGEIGTERLRIEVVSVLADDDETMPPLRELPEAQEVPSALRTWVTIGLGSGGALAAGLLAAAAVRRLRGRRGVGRPQRRLRDFAEGRVTLGEAEAVDLCWIVLHDALAPGRASASAGELRRLIGAEPGVRAEVRTEVERLIDRLETARFGGTGLEADGVRELARDVLRAADAGAAGRTA